MLRLSSHHASSDTRWTEDSHLCHSLADMKGLRPPAGRDQAVSLGVFKPQFCAPPALLSHEPGAKKQKSLRVLHPLPPALSRTGPDPCRAQIRASAAKQCSLSGMCHSDSKQYSLVTHRAMSVSIWASDASILASDAESSISKNPLLKGYDFEISRSRRRSNNNWHTLLSGTSPRLRLSLGDSP